MEGSLIMSAWESRVVWSKALVGGLVLEEKLLSPIYQKRMGICISGLVSSVKES